MVTTPALTTDDLSRRRRRILFAYMLTWGIWSLTLVVGTLTKEGQSLKSALHALWFLVNMVSWLAWMISMFTWRRFHKTLMNSGSAGHAIYDESFKLMQLKAGCAAAIASMIATVVVIGIGEFINFSAVAAGQIIMFAGVTTFFGAFLALDRESGDSKGED